MDVINKKKLNKRQDYNGKVDYCKPILRLITKNKEKTDLIYIKIIR